MKFNEQAPKELNLDESKKIELSPENEGSNLESKIVSLRIEIEGEENNIEAKSYYFEYPKYIQESTGILGYTRTKVNEEQFKDILNQGNTLEQTTQRYKPYALKGLNEIQDEFNSELRLKIAENLSRNEYPHKCYTHKMGAYVGENRTNYIEQFKNDKLFIQKIFDLDAIEKLSYRHSGNGSVFSHGAGEDYGYSENNFATIINKNDNEPKKERIIPSQVKDNLDNDHYAIFDGLNTELGKFWFTPSLNLQKSPVFGFKVESFHKEYLLKTLEILSYNKETNKSRMRHVVLALIDNDFLESNLFEELKEIWLKNSKEYGDHPRLFLRAKDSVIEDVRKKLNIFISEKFSYYKNKFENSLNLSDYLNQDSYWQKYVEIIANHRDEGPCPFPIFINHNELPQLSWGHAKYAHYVDTQGNFNFFEFKHADHLPDPNPQT